MAPDTESGRSWLGPLSGDCHMVYRGEDAVVLRGCWRGGRRDALPSRAPEGDRSRGSSAMEDWIRHGEAMAERVIRKRGWRALSSEGEWVGFVRVEEV